MLAAKDDELLTRTGPGTPMGGTLRRYWLPALLSEEISEPDGDPVQVRILGEHLVAFRDTQGNVGLVDEVCPHRGASLWYGRNEQGGLRCIFHGWKYDVTGQCVDMPTEPAGSGFREKIKAGGYPVREMGGVVWAYMGPRDKVPPFPELNWLTVPEPQRKVWKILQECNYAQALERDLDSGHIEILHGRLNEQEVGEGKLLTDIPRNYTAPGIEVEPTNCGFRYAAVRTKSNSDLYVRISAYMLPIHIFIPPGPDGERTYSAFVPIDDTTNWHFLVRFNLDGPIDQGAYERTRGLDFEDGFRKVKNADNRWMRDSDLMRTASFSGVTGIIVEDHFIAEIQGAIVDRTKHHLGATDTAIVALRDALLGAVAASTSGGDPPALDPSIPFDRVQSETITIPSGTSWQSVSPLLDGFALSK